ncbi:MAG: methyltransferase [bacterium]|nr:methyltransferase [bacterium]
MKEDSQMLSWKEEIDTWRVAADHAFVDGVFVETDMFYDFNPGRVFPILKEEQPIMWFLVREEIRRLREEKGDDALITVLDIGTGSGFFSLLCAKMGCFVAAIDNNPRAINFSARNAKANSIPLTRSDLLEESEVQTIAAMSPNPGKIHLFKGDMASLRIVQAGFDVVLLSPPYNPTHPHLVDNVAQHASAGPAGQVVFDRQIELLKKGSWLAADGACVLNHNSTCSLSQRKLAEDTLGDLHAVRHIQDTLGGNVEVAVYPGLSNMISVEEFLGRQYGDIRRSLNRESEYSFKEYSADVMKSGKSFAYIFAIIRRPDSPSELPVTLSRYQGELQAEDLHSRDWYDRIDAHRRIVNNTPRVKLMELRSDLAGTTALSLAGFLSPPASGMDLRSDWRAVNQLEVPAPKFPGGVFGIRLLQELDSYIRRERLEQRFPIMLVNASPMNGQSQEVITHQLGVWTKDTEIEEPGKKDRRIDIWENIIRKLHAAKMALFTQPAFCGTEAPDEDPWWPIVFISDSQLTDKGISLSGILDVYRKRYKHYSSIDEDEAASRNRRKEDSHYDANKRWACWAETLANIGSYNFKVAKREATDRISEILRVKNRDLTFAHFADDATVIHRLIHELADSEYLSLVDTNDKRSLRSWLVGIPLGHIFHKCPADHSGPPPHYRGALWIYMASAEDAERTCFTELSDFVKHVWLLVTGMYDAEWESIDKDISEASGIQAIEQQLGHEVIKGYSPALRLLRGFEESVNKTFVAELAALAMLNGILYTPTIQAASSLREIDRDGAVLLGWRIYLLREIFGETMSLKIANKLTEEIKTIWNQPPTGFIELSDDGFFDWVASSNYPTAKLRAWQLFLTIVTNGIKHHVLSESWSSGNSAARIRKVYKTHERSLKKSIGATTQVLTCKYEQKVILRVSNPSLNDRDRWEWSGGTPHAIALICRLYHSEMGIPYHRHKDIVRHELRHDRYIVECSLPLGSKLNKSGGK